MTQNSPARDIADLIATDSGLALTLGTSLHAHEIPETPDRCVAVFSSGGYPPGFHGDQTPTVQVMVRGDISQPEPAYQLAQSIREWLHGQHNVVTGGSRCLLISAMGDILDVGPDDKRRPILTINFAVERTASEED